MTKPQFEAVESATEAERPHLLVLHAESADSQTFESAADHEQRLIQYFSAVVQSAVGLRGLREITLELPHGAGGRALLHAVSEAAAAGGFDVRAVAWAEQVSAWGPEAFRTCREVALRVDARRFRALRLSSKLYAAVDLLHAESRVVGLHVLLDRGLVTQLTLSKLRTWLARTDFVTLVAPRLQSPDFGHPELVALFDRLAPLWERADRFFHLQVDRSIKPAFFPWNLLSVTCPASDLALHLETDGRLFLCAAQRPFAILDNPSGFAASVDRYLESSKHAADLCEGLPLGPR